MERITNRDLDASAERLNKLLGQPVKEWIEGKAQIGNYHVSQAYGGNQLHQMMNEGGGIRVISHGGYVTKRELYNQIQALISHHYAQTSTGKAA